MSIPAKTRYEWELHCAYCGDREFSAVEVRPKTGGLMNWRFAVPAEAEIVGWGCGPSGNQAHSPARRSVAETEKAVIGDSEVVFFGAGDRLSQGVAAYVVFRGRPPEFVAFGCEAVGGNQGKFMMERVTFVSLLDKALEDARAKAEGGEGQAEEDTLAAQEDAAIDSESTAEEASAAQA